MIINSRLKELHNEILEMKFECLASANIDGIDLQTSKHELAASPPTGQQDNGIAKIVSFCK